MAATHFLGLRAVHWAGEEILLWELWIAVVVPKAVCGL